MLAGLDRTRRVAVAALILLGACAAERSAPQPTRPPPPSAGQAAAPRRTVPPDATSGEEERATPSSTERAPSERATTTSSSTTTTTTTLPPPSPEAWAAFDEALSRRLLGSGDFSASVAVARHGELLHEAAFGVRVPVLAPPATTTIAPSSAPASSAPASTVPTTTNPGSTSAVTSVAGSSVAPTTTAAPATTPLPVVVDEPTEPTDRFRIASISKVVAAAVTVQLVEDGELELDEPVGRRLAEMLGVTLTEPLVGTVTVRQLLSHTSGFDVYERTFFGGAAATCRDAAVRGLSGGLNSPPGTTYDYSNMNYCLIGLLVEDVTGQPFEDVARERYLDRLGISGMRMVKTFDPDPDEVVHPSIPGRVYMEALGAAGAWVATAQDVVRIADSLEPSRPGWHPVSRDLLSLMRVPAPTAAVPAVRTQWYGLGEIVFGDGSWGHTGTVENTHAMVLVRPDGVTWSILVSGEYPSRTGRLRELFDAAIADAGLHL